MKFHNLYVYFLNPIKIIILGLLTALSVLMLLNVNLIPADQWTLPGVTYVQGDAVLIVLVVVLGFSFLFALIAEILLAMRRVAGVMLLVLGYFMEVASSVVNVIHDVSTTSIMGLVVSAFIAYLVCLYYWKRAKLLH